MTKTTEPGSGNGSNRGDGGGPNFYRAGDDLPGPAPQSSPDARERLSLGAEVLARRVAERSGGDVDCDILIVGSGYGGAVAAARLAGATKPANGGTQAVSVWLLERGLEHPSGSFPSRFADVPGEVRFSRQDGQPPRGAAEGLYDMRLGDDVNVILGNGLGGGSLINAGVMAEPLADRFAGWPGGISLAALADQYQMVRTMVQAAELPAGQTVKKLQALEKINDAAEQQRSGNVFQRAQVAVTFAPHQQTPAGVPMCPCTKCGDCVSGCNQGAKNTLDTNYLAWAVRSDAKVFCGGWVSHVEKVVLASGGPAWRVHWHFTSPAKRPADGAAFTVTARRVILAAGSLGSTEILLRSSKAGLALATQQLGRRFSTNGDQIAAVFRQDIEVNASRDEDDDPAADCTVGPTISGVVRQRRNESDIVVQDFGIPAPLKRVMGKVTTTFGLIHGLFGGKAPGDPGSWKVDHPADREDFNTPKEKEDPFAVTTSAFGYTSILGLMGDDGAAGTLQAAMPMPAGQGKPAAPATDGQLRIVWPADTQEGRKLEQLWQTQIDWLQEAIAPIEARSRLVELAGDADQARIEVSNRRLAAPSPGGTVVPNPLWRALPQMLSDAIGAARGSAITSHPLGGCAIGASAADGVVNDAGQVFDGSGSSVHVGLVVLDGSIVRNALGINPALTIAALAERAIPIVAGRWGLTLRDQTSPGSGAVPIRPARPAHPSVPAVSTGIRIREQMVGKVELGGQRYWAQLEIPALPIRDVARTLRYSQQSRTLPFETSVGNKPKPPVLRLYKWNDAPFAIEPRNALGPLHTVPLTGQMRLFDEVDGDAVQAVLEGLSVAIERLRARSRTATARASSSPSDEPDLGSVQELLGAFFQLAKGRTIEYRFAVTDPDGVPALQAGDTIVGLKTLAFNERGNPWQQLMQMAFMLQPQAPANAAPLPLGRLKTDLGYFATWREALFSLMSQRNHPDALADLAGFGLYVLRLLIATHWPHFMPPGDMPQKIDERRPGPVDGVAPEHYDVPGECGKSVAKLSRYVKSDADAGAAPVVLIHGLSAAGSTFAHASIPGNLVSFLLRAGRDVWVLDLQTSSVNDPPAGKVFTFEQVAGQDVPAAIDMVMFMTGGRKVDVVAHCVGAVMFCMAALSPPGLADRVRRVVLSQSGPIADLGPFNRFRGYLASFLRAYLSAETIDVRPEYHRDASGAWVKADATDHRHLMVDALLATFPYPDDDFEAARVTALPADFRIVRHRVDAIFGRMFDVDNLSDETLLSLDAIYGWTKTQTLAQVIHIARERRLADADGFNRCVSGAAIAKRLGFPILMLHGLGNEVFDWRGSLDSHRALQLDDISRPAPPVAATADGHLHLGAGTPRQLLVLRGYNHQDTMIGRNARYDVFPRIGTFLNEPIAVPRPRGPSTPQFECVEPWIGPMLGWLRAVPNRRDDIACSLLVHAGPRRHDVLGVVLVPLLPWPAGADGVTRWQWQLDAARVFGANRDTLFEQALPVRMTGISGDEPVAMAVLLLHRKLNDPSESTTDFIGQATRGSSIIVGGKPLTDAARAAVEAYASRNGADGVTVRLDPKTLAARDRGPGTTAPSDVSALTFAVGSCQFPAALFDRVVAGNSYRNLQGRLEAAAGNAPSPQLLLLLGDQVYLDALGNVFEAPGSDPVAQARAPYEITWRLPPLRRVVAQLPVYPLLDDHEIEDNWQPPSGPLSPHEVAALNAYRHYQGKLAPPPLSPAVSASYRFSPGGMPFFVLDTRRRRDKRHIVAGRGRTHLLDASIAAPSDFIELEDWLRQHRKAPFKFIASSVVLLPFQGAGLDPVERLRFDSWSGYPASLHRVLDFIEREAIEGVVFLSGDPHLSLHCDFTFKSNGIAVTSIVSSGTYAPWPFANQQPSSLMPDGFVSYDCGNGRRIDGTLAMRTVCDRDGFAIVTATAAHGTSPAQLQVSFLGCPAGAAAPAAAHSARPAVAASTAAVHPERMHR